MTPFETELKLLQRLTDDETLPFWGLSQLQVALLAQKSKVDNGIVWDNFCEVLKGSQPQEEEKWKNYDLTEIHELFCRLFYPTELAGSFAHWEVQFFSSMYAVTLHSTLQRNNLDHQISLLSERAEEKKLENGYQNLSKKNSKMSVYVHIEPIEIPKIFPECVKGIEVIFTPEFKEYLWTITGQKNGQIDWETFCSLLVVNPRQLDPVRDEMLAFHHKLVGAFDEPDYHGVYYRNVPIPANPNRRWESNEVKKTRLSCQEWFVQEGTTAYIFTLKWSNKGQGSGEEAQPASLEVNRLELGDKSGLQQFKNRVKSAQNKMKPPAVIKYVEKEQKRSSLLLSLFSVLDAGWVNALEVCGLTPQPKNRESDFSRCVNTMEAQFGREANILRQLRHNKQYIGENFREYDWLLVIDGVEYVAWLKYIVATKKPLLQFRKLTAQESKAWKEMSHIFAEKSKKNVPLAKIKKPTMLQKKLEL